MGEKNWEKIMAKILAKILGEKLGRKSGRNNWAKKRVKLNGEFYELRNFMSTWSQEEQQEQELHEYSANRLYECEPVKNKTRKKRFPMNRLPLCFTFFASQLFGLLVALYFKAVLRYLLTIKCPITIELAAFSVSNAQYA